MRSSLTFKAFSAIPIILPLLFCSCGIPPANVTVDDHFNKLFHIDSGGVTGTDGTISIPLADGSSVFVMGDFFMGKVINGRRDSTPDIVLGNVLITVDKDQKTMENWYRGTADNPETFLAPLGDDPNVSWIWPGHGFEHEGILHLFMLNYTSDTWAFRGSDYLRLKVPGFEILSQERFLPSLAKGIRWGMAVINDPGAVYIYGGDFVDSLPDTNVGVHVCKATLSEDNSINKITYFDGENWTSDPMESQRMNGTNISISEQYSVFKLSDFYVLLSHERGYKSTRIYSYTAAYPQGPWSNEQMLYETKENLTNPNIFTYNAMAHPQYSENGNLLISYNVTSSFLREIYLDASIYRPMFLRVPFDLILKDHDSP